MVVWVLVHDLGRSGVPVALARMLEWHATSADRSVELHVIAGRDGPLRPRLTAAATSVTVLEPEHDRTLPATLAVGSAQLLPAHPSIGRIARQICDRSWRRRVRAVPEPDLVLVHGAGAWGIWCALRAACPPVPYLVHLHELDIGLARSVPAADRRPFLGEARLVLTVDETTAGLARHEGVPDTRLRIVAGACDDPRALRWTVDADPVGTDPPSSVVGIGPPGWRKGADRFLAVAHTLRHSHPEVGFHWIGGEPEGADAWATDAALPVTWHPATTDPWALVPPGAVLLVPSREDPLPLVALEAGRRGVPIVAAATGGLPALLDHGRGLVVAGHDLPAMADAVRGCLDDRSAAQRRAVALHHHVSELHRAEVVGPRWLDALTEAGSPPEAANPASPR
jgi:glycosyltransferase involved in cell wall biosynthesis